MPIRARLLVLLPLLCTPWITWADGLVNRLADNPSPYLAQHAADPVAWQEWGPEVLALARSTNRPILISSGYFSCHWCHVMQREVFQDPEVAALINQGFIPVKIDRELLPALDDHLIEFVRRTRGVAGWPLNVFLTPEGYPFFGLVYAPRASFHDLLDRIAKTWAERGAKLRLDAQLAAIVLPAATVETTASSVDVAGLLRADLLHQGDALQGGLGSGNRFPTTPVWEAALDLLAGPPDPELAGLATLTLDRMAALGMRDAIGGGFFRYTTDPDWETPHFEKMLYDQALLIRLYLRAATVLGRPEYREVARDTLRFVLAEMQAPDGGFISSLSAVDDAGKEGEGYLWSGAQLAAALDDGQRAFAAARWVLETQPGGAPRLPRVGRDLAAIAEAGGHTLAEVQALEASVRARLRMARGDRRHPADGKRLAAWNGLMLAAFADARAELGDSAYESAALALRTFLVDGLMADGRLVRAREAGRIAGEAGIEDYAGVALGLWRWHEVHGDPRDRAAALDLLHQAWRRFHDGRGWRQAEAGLLPGMGTKTALADNPLPSPSAIILDLSRRSGVPDLEARAAKAIAEALPAVVEQPVGFAGHARLFLGFPADPRTGVE